MRASSNPTPWGGTTKLPNGAAFPGPVRYTDSLVVLDARTGRLLWYDQVTPHDVRDYDFSATPILAKLDGAPMVFGAGKAGLVIAWNRRTRRRVWTTPVGLRRNASGPLPRRRVTVCPGNLRRRGDADGIWRRSSVRARCGPLCPGQRHDQRQNVDKVVPSRGRGRLLALDAHTGHILWDDRFPSPDFGCATVSNDVVFTSTYAGTVYALAAATGRVLWSVKMPGEINGCPAVLGDTLIVEAGFPAHPGDRPEMVAFRIP